MISAEVGMFESGFRKLRLDAINHSIGMMCRCVADIRGRIHVDFLPVDGSAARDGAQMAENLDAIQRQAALAGGLFGQSFDIPGLALTLNLKPELKGSSSPAPSSGRANPPPTGVQRRTPENSATGIP